MNSAHPSRGRRRTVPLVMMLAGSLVLAGALFWLNQSPKEVSANGTYAVLAQSTYNLSGTRIDPVSNCSFCHTPSIPALNPYGTAFRDNGRNAAALAAIENIDSDGDGFTNIQEINARTFPGDPLDHPVAPTATSTPTRTPTNTTVPPTATNVPPTATNTALPPTATNVPPTATGVPPTATLTRTATNTALPPTATSVGPTATSLPPTATLVSTATRTPTVVVSGTAVVSPTVRASLTPNAKCIRDTSSFKKSGSSDDDKGEKRRCPKGFHTEDDEREHEKELVVARLREIFSRSESKKDD